MDIHFSKKYLEDLYVGDIRKYKKYKSNPKLVAQYVKTINKLKAITRIEQLFQIKSLKYEKKSGDLKGVSVVRVNDKYRLHFYERSTDPGELTIDLLEIEELTKHYEK